MLQLPLNSLGILGGELQKTRGLLDAPELPERSRQPRLDVGRATEALELRLDLLELLPDQAHLFLQPLGGLALAGRLVGLDLGGHVVEARLLAVHLLEQLLQGVKSLLVMFFFLRQYGKKLGIRGF